MLNLCYLNEKRSENEEEFQFRFYGKGNVCPGAPMNVIHSSVRGLRSLKQLETEPESLYSGNFLGPNGSKNPFAQNQSRILGFVLTMGRS